MERLFDLMIKGIGTSLVCFTILGIGWDIINGGNYVYNNWGYTKMVIGAIVVGIGFSLPCLIYYKPKIPYVIKIIIHMGIGSTIFLITSFVVGWIPVSLGLGKSILTIVIELSLAFILWLCYYLYYKRMAKKMNEEIKRINDRDTEYGNH